MFLCVYKWNLNTQHTDTEYRDVESELKLTTGFIVYNYYYYWYWQLCCLCVECFVRYWH